MKFKLLTIIIIYFLIENSSFGNQFNQLLCHKNVAEYKIDSSKIEKCIDLLSEFERGIDNGVYHDKSVLKGVSMTEIIRDLRYMLSNPNGTKIGYLGHYCGPSAILNWLINCCPDKYVKTVLELAYTGKTKNHNSHTVLKVSKRVRNKINYNRVKNKWGVSLGVDLDSTSISDFLLCTSLVNSEKLVQKIGLIWKRALYNKNSIGSFIYTNTMPWEINDYFKKLGVKVINQNYYFGKKNCLATLYFIEDQVLKGNMPLIFDNHLISYAQTKNLIYKTVGAHFITIHSLAINEENNTVEYSYWDYGSVKQSPFKSKKGRFISSGSLAKDMRIMKRMQRKKVNKKVEQISIEDFLRSMKGYWIPIE